MYPHEQRQYEAPPGRPLTPPPPVDPGGWTRFNGYIASRGLDAGIAKRNGWYPAFHEGAHRIVIPAVSQLPGHKFWQARAIESPDKPLDPAIKRYTSAHGSKGDAIVVIWPDSLGAGPRILAVVEGPFDALAAAETHGVFGIALMGMSPPVATVCHLVAWATATKRPLTLVPDCDRGSMGAFALLGAKLEEHGASWNFDPLPFGAKDLAGMSREARANWFAPLVSDEPVR